MRRVKIKPQDMALVFDGTHVERFLAADLDGASEFNMAQQVRFFVRKDKVKDVLETLEGYDPPHWPSLKASMVAYWGQVDTARFTLPDLEALTQSWTAKGGVSSVVDYQDFRRVWEPIQSYLLRKAHIDSVEEVRTLYYRSLPTGVQERVRDHLIKAKTMITTLDNRFKLPSFEILKEAVADVMKGQTALTFEHPRTSSPVPVGTFQQGNEIMQQMKKDRCPTAPAEPPKPSATVDEISRMLQSFEQRLGKKFTAQTLQPSGKVPPSERGPLVCYYCHREGHGTGRCFELKKDKEANLVEQEGKNFFLPNGALIPFDSSRPIRHVVASFQPPPTASVVTPEFRTTCGTLDPWYPPAVTSQSFSGSYEADPARKKHEAPKPYKAPAVPLSAARKPAKQSTVRAPNSNVDDSDMEAELFERVPASPIVDLSPPEKSYSKQPAKPASAAPKVRFERGISKDHPNAVEGVLKKISGLKVPDLSVSELLAVALSVAEGMKRWVLRKRVEIGAEELKVSSGTLAEGVDFKANGFKPRLYSCPLGYLPCLVGDEESNASPLLDSGSQLNLILDAMANKFNISPRVNFSSAVYGIGNQACELVGVAEDVPLHIGKSIVGTCHFWITRMVGPMILGRPFLMDFNATLSFSGEVGERILLPDANGRMIEVSLCATDSGRWEREFPGKGKKAILTRSNTARDDPVEGRHFFMSQVDPSSGRVSLGSRPRAAGSTHHQEIHRSCFSVSFNTQNIKSKKK
ncbi:hypothetical protein PTTG_08445 [Puccinia triticina 1-1 BBBD Race 1]|uniref:Peptidase A2 domain-containing protein n=1 Tax=Puccinia triticina (isolate 1-1 / race 1 (BBBD)) TaxID=630390 RepID=A0A180G6V5_PUCT1|nr:hypothetical protein PTTG_08445 [Puccinia triticina 1-1 BBBD Race 1]